MVRIAFAPIFLLSFVTTLYCQTSQPYGALNNTQSIRDELGIAMQNGVQNAYTLPRRYEGIQGNPFLSNTWSPGVVCLVKDSAIVSDPKIKYKFESFTNELWILNGKDSMIAYSKDIHWFLLENEKESFTFFKFPKYSNGNPNKFFRNLYNGKKIRFVQEIRKELRRADFIDKGMYTAGLPYDRFEEKNIYLMSVGNDIFRKIKLNLSDLTDLMDAKTRKKAKAFAKDNKLKGKLTEEEAIRIIEFSDQGVD